MNWPSCIEDHRWRWLITSILVVIGIIVTIVVPLWPKSPSKEQLPPPTLDFDIHNKQSGIKSGKNPGEKLTREVTDFIKFKTLSPGVRLNRIKIGYPSVMYDKKKDKTFRINGDPFVLWWEDEMMASPPDYKWNIRHLVKLLEFYFIHNDLIYEEAPSFTHFISREIPISILLDYTYLGEKHLLKSIYEINYDLLWKNINHKTQKVEIVINNIYLIKNVNPDDDIRNELNSVFNEKKEDLLND